MTTAPVERADLPPYPQGSERPSPPSARKAGSPRQRLLGGQRGL